MRPSWQNQPLADFVISRPGNNKIIKGKQSDQPGDGLVQGFSASGPDVWVTVAEYHQPGVVISAVGARCGKTFPAAGEWTAIANTHVLLPGKDIDPRWLWYRTNDEEFWVKGGAAQPFVKVKDTLQQPIPVPPLPEQQRIVRVLDEAFEGLAVAQATAEKNLQNARALFESHLQSVFTKRGKGWVDATLADVLAVLRNGMNCKQDKSGMGSKISRIESIWNARFDITRVGYAEIAEAQKDKFLLKKGDVLFSHINSAIHVGKTALFDLEDEVVHGVNLLLMRTKSFILPAYLDLYLKHIFSAGYWLRVCKQSINQASVNQQDINRVPFRYPALERQREVVEQMDALSAETQRLAAIYEQKLAALAELKKSLLHQAFSGAL